MAGSLNHIIDDEGKFTMSLIDNLGDAHEALNECFNIILLLTEGTSKLDEICEKLKYCKPKLMKGPLEKWDDVYLRSDEEWGDEE